MLGSSGDRQQAGRAPNTPLLPFIERKNKERIVQITARPRGSPTRRSVTRRCGLLPQARGEQPGEATPHLGAPCGRSQRHRGPHGRPRPSPQPPPARRPRSPRTHHGCGLSLPRGGSGLGAALRSPHGRAAPEAPPVRRAAAAASSQAPGPVPGRRARGAPGRWEGPPEGRPMRAAGGTGNGAATGGAAAAPPGASCGSARPAPPAGSGRPAPPTNHSRGCGVPRVRSPPQRAPVRHLEEGRDVSQGGGRCALGGAPRPAPALLRVRARPFPPCRKREEEGRGSFGHAPSEGWACWRVSGAGVARQRGGGRRGLGPEPGPEPRPMPRPRLGVPLPALVTRMAGPRSTFVSSNHTSYGSQSLLWHFSVTRDR